MPMYFFNFLSWIKILLEIYSSDAEHCYQLRSFCCIYFAISRHCTICGNNFCYKATAVISSKFTIVLSDSTIHYIDTGSPAWELCLCCVQLQTTCFWPGLKSCATFFYFYYLSVSSFTVNYILLLFLLFMDKPTTAQQKWIVSACIKNQIYKHGLFFMF